MSKIQLRRLWPVASRGVSMALTAGAIFMSSTSGSVAASSAATNENVAIPASVLAWLTPDSGGYTQQELAQIQQMVQALDALGYFGDGSYICSPAGSGMKSRCFAR